MHRDVELPTGDLLIHAGDITFFSKRSSVLADFNDWLGEQPHRYKVVIPGNHDRLLSLPENRRLITKAHLLINSGVELGGAKIWGSPITIHPDVAFGLPDLAARRELWTKIPDGLDILVTHGPPAGVLDGTSSEGPGSGCAELRKAIALKQPRVHVFGHAHGAYGTKAIANTLFINAALAGKFGDLDKAPVWFTMELRNLRKGM